MSSVRPRLICSGGRHKCFTQVPDFNRLIIDNHVKNQKYRNFVSISSLTGEYAAEKLKKLLQFQSMDMFTSYGHIKSQNKITDFFMILGLASPFKDET